jgi:NAD(P)-dependent dehydrogenase (short-subunit alcohol dehydrogenase family)
VPECRHLALDVNDENSMSAAVDAVLADAGHIDALINNAGYTVTASAPASIATRRLLSDRAWDMAMRSQFPRPKP